MYTYTFLQWIIFFYIYCIAGWIWETGYVSIREKKFVNRGFMNGPMLPIYGSGAVIILLATIPVKKYALAVFIFGMIAASILEYITGSLMERLFHVRYWDYSDHFMNLNGHICLLCSITWGFFSLAMVYLIHVPVEKAVLWIPTEWISVIAFVTTVLFVVDFTMSFRDAMDLREILENITQNNVELQRLQKRLEVRAAFAGEELEEMKQKLERVKGRTEYMLESVSQNVNMYISELMQTNEEKKLGKLEEREQIFQEFEGFKKFLNELEGKKLRESQKRTWRRCKRMIYRNSKAVSKKYEDALSFIKRQNQNK